MCPLLVVEQTDKIYIRSSGTDWNLVKTRRKSHLNERTIMVSGMPSRLRKFRTVAASIPFNHRCG